MYMVIKWSVMLLLAAASLGFGPGETGKSKMEHSFGKLPLYFVENRGQMDLRVDFYVRGSDKILYFTSEGVTFALTKKAGDEKKQWNLKLDFLGARGEVKPRGEDKKEAVFSYFKGKPEEWNTAIPTYGKLVYTDLWPGIDLVYSGTVNRLKYEFIVKPGADPGQIRLTYRGADRVAVNAEGELDVTTPAGGFSDGKPYAYQLLDGEEKEVSMEYALESGNRDDGFTYGFDLGTYNPDEPLFLDPVLLVYCGYIGGSGDDEGKSICVDSEGCAYVTGRTVSSEASFPVAVGPDLIYSGCYDAFVAKVNLEGTALMYCGYIGGDGGAFTEVGHGIAVDDYGCAYVAGATACTESTFPVLLGPDLTYNGGLCDGFVAKVNSNGTALEYCGYIGGDDWDIPVGIAVNDSGQAYVSGYTRSTETKFPVAMGPDLTYNGGDYDAFVAKVNTNGTALDYCGYIGGSNSDSGMGIALDSLGYAYVTGATASTETTFPVLTGPDLTHNGGNYDGFVAKVHVSGMGLMYCSYIGGDDSDQAMDISVDSQFYALVTGSTKSTEATFPVKSGPDLTHNGGSDAFIAKVSKKATNFIYCGYLGGNGDDGGSGIAVDAKDQVHVTGHTNSSESSFPVVMGPDLTYNGQGDAFVAGLDNQGTALEYCGYIGGSEFDTGMHVAVDSYGHAYVIGDTKSDESSFPVAVGPDLTANNVSSSSGDAFVAKVAMALAADAQEVSEATGGTVHFDLNAGENRAGRNYILLGGITGTSPGTPLPGGLATLPLNWDLFTGLLINLINTPVFQDFMGTLNGKGSGNAALNLGPVPGAAGMVIYFAYALNAPWDFASNPVSVQIVP